jgi:hypothetical protein
MLLVEVAKKIRVNPRNWREFAFEPDEVGLTRSRAQKVEK